MHKISLIAGLVTLSTIFTSQTCALAANLVTNGGFEDLANSRFDPFVGWDSGGFDPSDFANSGSVSAEVVASSGSPGSLTQVLDITFEKEYQLSFFLNSQRGDPGGLINNGLVVRIDEIVILNLINRVTNGYEKFTFNFIVPRKKALGALLSFDNALVNNNFTTFLDDVSVMEVTPVPFEFSPALGIGVLGGLFVAKKLSSKLLKK